MKQEEVECGERLALHMSMCNMIWRLSDTSFEFLNEENAGPV